MPVSSQQSVRAETLGPRPRAQRTALRSVMATSTYEPCGSIARIDPLFEDTCRFTPAGTLEAEPSAAEWVRQVLHTVAALVAGMPATHRPVTVALPGAALTDPDLALAAVAGVGAGLASPQEFILEVSPAALGVGYSVGLDALERLAERGFRIGLDATRSAELPWGHRARHLFDQVRVIAADLTDTACPVPARSEVWLAGGAYLIAERAQWREAETLAALGVTALIAPRCDG